MKSEKELVCELNGMALWDSVRDKELKKGIIKIVEPTGGRVDYSRISCYQLVNENLPTFRKIYEYSYPFEEMAPREDARYLFFCIDGEMLLYDRTETVVYDSRNAEIRNRLLELQTIPQECLYPLEYEIDCEIDVSWKAKKKTIAVMTDKKGDKYEIAVNSVLGLGLSYVYKPKDAIRIYRIN